MSVTLAAQDVKSASLNVVVTRCGCTTAEKARRNWHARNNLPCPNPRATEDHGTVAFWHRNPIRVAMWRASRLIRRKV